MAVAIVATLLLSERLASATDYVWTAAIGDYNLSTDWSPLGPPGGGNGTFVHINNGGDAQTSTGFAQVQDIDFDGAAGGTMDQSGGTGSLTGWLRMGDVDGQSGDYGNYNLSGSAILNLSRIDVGEKSGATVSTFTQSGTSVVNMGVGLYGGILNIGGWADLNGTGYAGTGTYNLSGGTLNVGVEYGAGTIANMSMNVGVGAGGVGVLNISGTGDLEIQNGDAHIGSFGGTGTVNQTGGTANIETGSNGNWLFVGDGGSTGTYNLSGGMMTVGAQMVMARGAGSHGTFRISGSATLRTGGDIVVDNGGVGLFEQTGGSVNTGTGWVSIGTSGNPGASGTYNMSGGTLATGRLVLATNRSNGSDNGVGIFNHTGGVVNSNLDVSVGDLGTGTYTISGPSSGSNAVILNAGVTGSVASGGEGIQLGWNATGVFNQNGGVVNALQTGVGFNGATAADTTVSAAQAGTYNLTGGVLNTAAIFKAKDPGLATFNFNGGTVRATADNATFMQGLTAANVQAGGAVFDTHGKVITVAQPLVNGVTGIDGGLTLDDALGTGSLTLSGTNTFNGPTNVTAGTLIVGNSLALQNSTVNVTVSNSVQFLPGIGQFTFGGLSGTANLVLQDTLANPITALTVGKSNASTNYSGVISGGGGLLKIGTGSLTFTAAQSYTGPTMISSGTLNLNSLGSLALESAVTVGGASATGTPTIAGTGSVNGSLTVNGPLSGAAGHVAPGVNTGESFGGIGVFHSGSLTLNGGSVLDFDLGNPGTGSGNLAGKSDLIAVTGTLSLPTSGNVTLTLSDNSNQGGLGSIGLGTYKLISAANIVNFNPNIFSTGASPLPGATYVYSQNAAHTEIDVTIATKGWSPGAVSGDWADSANWVGGIIPGATSSTTNSDTASFSSSGNGQTQIVTDLNRNLRSITFDSASAAPYTIGATNGNALLLTSGGTIQSTVSVGNSETINAPLTLQGINATLAFESDSSDNTKLLNFGGQITAGAGGSAVLTLSGANVGPNTIGGVIGNGSATSLAIFKSGAGTWVLGANNTFTGGVTIDAGTLRSGNLGALNSSSPNTIAFDSASSGTLALNGNSITIRGLNTTSADAQVINGNSAAGTLSVNSATPSSFSGELADGAGGGLLNLVVSGGSLTLTNGNTFGGTTNVTGTATLGLANVNALQYSTLNLTIGNSVVFNAGLGTFTLGGLSGNANLALQDAATNPIMMNVGNNNANVTYAGVLSGSGGVNKIGTGTLTLTNANTYSGVTTVSGGTLRLGDGLTKNGSVASASIVSNAALGFANPNAQTYGGIISGAGLVSKTGTGMLTLTASNSFAGGMTINAGTVVAGPSLLSSLTSPIGTGQVTLAASTLTFAGVLNQGLAANFYNNGPININNQSPDYNSLPALTSHFSGLTPAVSSSTIVGGKTNLDFSNNGYGSNAPFNSAGGTTAAYGFSGNATYEATFSGFINIMNPGSYTFSTTSDDGSVVFIDGGDGTASNGNPAVGNNAYQVATTRISNPINLTAGRHAIQIGFYQGTGGQGLLVQYNGPDTSGNTVTIPNSVLSIASSGLYTPAQAYSANLAVTADSTVNVTNSTTASLGTLSIGAKLNLTGDPGASLKLGPTTLIASSSFDLAANTTLKVDAITDAAHGYSLTKTGAGTLQVPNGGTYGGGTTISQGTVGVASNTSLGTGTVTLSSGRLQLQANSFLPAIGINFDGGSNGVAPAGLLATETAGVVPITNWNNAPSNTASTANIEGPIAGSLVDSTGAATGAKVFYNSNSTWEIGQSLTDGNHKLMSGYLDLDQGRTTTSVIFLNLPFRSYNVYAYVGSDGNSSIGNGAINGTTIYFTTNDNPFNGFDQATGTSGPHANFANYLLFQNVTGSSFEYDQNGNTGNVGLHGMEIVSTEIQPVVMANNLTVTADSTIDVTGADSATIQGNLSIGGQTLFVTGSSAGANLPYNLNLGFTTLTGSPTFDIAKNGSGSGIVSLRSLSTGGAARTITKANSGILEIQGPSTLDSGTSFLANAGTLRFNNVTADATIGTGVTATVASGATLELAGSISALGSAAGNRVHLVNNSTASGIVVSGTNQVVGDIDGSGNTQVNAGSGLTADHIIQNALIISGAAGNTGFVTIDASDSAGNPLGQSNGLALAGPLMPSGPLAEGLICSASVSTANIDNADLAVLAMGKSVGSNNPAPVPEPPTLLLALLAVLGVVSTQFARHHFRWQTI